MTTKYGPHGEPLGELRRLPVFFAWAIAGLILPDVDQAVPLLPHRSGLTHSILPCLAILWFGGRLAAAGTAAGIAVALADDLFPNRFIGAALIHLPFVGSIGLMTIPWLITNVAACLGFFILILSVELQKRATLTAAFVFSLSLAFAYLALYRQNIAALVLLLLLFAGVTCILRRVSPRLKLLVAKG